MSLLNDILQQNNQIAQNPTSVIRTPTQVAYDNLLNRQAEIEKQNKTNGLVGGLMSGIGGLGKIIASAVVKNPFQQAGAMEGLTQQEGRIDQLRQAYENARQTKNRDYIQQAKEQLGMAQADEDKAYNRELTANQIAYKKAQDELAQKNYEKEQETKAQQRAEDVAFRNQQADQAQKNFDRQYNLKLSELNNKPAEMTPEQKLALELRVEDAKANAKAKREAEQDLNKALAGQTAFQQNIEHIKDLSKDAGNVFNRSIGGVASLFTGKDADITKANNAMGELVSQIRQAALVASGISGESDDKAQQAKLKDIYERAGVPMNAKSLTQAQVSSILNNIENIYKQRVAEKQNLLNSFNDFTIMEDANGNKAKVYKDGRIEEI